MKKRMDMLVKRSIITLGVAAILAGSPLMSLSTDAAGRAAKHAARHSVKTYSTVNTYNRPVNSNTASAIIYNLDAARAIVLQKAGVNEKDVVFTKQETEFEDDYRTYIHDFEFYTSTNKIEAEVNASTGAVVEYKVKSIRNNFVRPDKNQGQTVVDPGAAHPHNPNTSQMITYERAKELAANAAGLSASGVWFEDVELDGTKYELDFKAGGFEYEVEINAYTGEVIKFEKEWD